MNISIQNLSMQFLSSFTIANLILRNTLILMFYNLQNTFFQN
jgi:hypothetical protein